MINFKIILNVLGYLLIALSFILLIPAFLDLTFNNETWQRSEEHTSELQSPDHPRMPSSA